MKNTDLDQKKSRNPLESKMLRMGTYSAIITAVALAIAVAVNLFIGQIPSKYTKLDMSREKRLSISQYTETALENLEDSVDIYLIVQSGSEDPTIMQMLNLYKDMNQNITVSIKDPVDNPTFATQYTSAEIYNNSVIVVSGERSRYIGYEEIYATNNVSAYLAETAGQTTTDFSLEECLTSAIGFVTSETLPKMYVLTGHGEIELTESLGDSVTKTNVEMVQVNLLSLSAIPEDCACLFIYSPETDISTYEKDLIEQYLLEGGNLLLITDYSAALLNLTALMEYYSVEAVEGVVLENDSSHFLRGYNHYLLPDLNEHIITSPLIASDYRVLMPITQGLVQYGSVRYGVEVTSLLSTSDVAFSKRDITNGDPSKKEAGDIDGPFSVGVAITDTSGQEETNLVWFTTSGMLNDTVDAMVSGGNSNLFLNAVSWMCGQEDNISIHPKNISISYLTISNSANTLWSIMFVGVIPVTILILGIIVWVRRKRR